MTDDLLSLRELRALRATVQNGTITRAARALGVSQPAVSRSLGTLETKIGRQLFERRGRQVVPTAEALTLNAALDALFSALDRVNESAFVARTPTPLRIVSSTIYAAGFIQEQFGALRRADPDLRMELDTCSSREMLERLTEGHADLALSDADFDHDAVVSEIFAISAAVCLLPADHRLATRSALQISDLANEPYIALARGHPNRKRIDHLFAGEERNIVADVSVSTAAIEFVRLGLGVTVLNPFPILNQPDLRLAAIPITPRIEYQSRVSWCRDAPLSLTARRFIAQLRLAPTRAAATSAG